MKYFIISITSNFNSNSSKLEFSCAISNLTDALLLARLFILICREMPIGEHTITITDQDDVIVFAEQIVNQVGNDMLRISGDKIRKQYYRSTVPDFEGYRRKGIKLFGVVEALPFYTKELKSKIIIWLESLSEQLLPQGLAVDCDIRDTETHLLYWYRTKATAISQENGDPIKVADVKETEIPLSTNSAKAA